MTGAVELRGVTRRFGAHVAVHRADLRAEPGRTLALLSSSGCGIAIAGTVFEISRGGRWRARWR